MKIKITDLKKFNIDKVFAVEKIQLSNKNTLELLLLITRFFISSVFIKYELVIKNNHVSYRTDSIFLKSQDRDDYNQLFSLIINQHEGSKIVLELKKRKNFNFNLIFKYFINCPILFKIKKSNNLLLSIFFFLRFNRLLNQFEDILNLDFKNLIVFSEVQPIENFLVQLCNIIGKNTITLQHGLYIENKSILSIDDLNYRDVQSKIVLTWGKTTNYLFKKYNPLIKTIICGDPRLQEIPNKNFNTQNIGLILDGANMKETNINMIDLVSNFAIRKNKKVKIRIHPYDKNIYIFDLNILMIDNNLDDCHIIIGHSSSLLYQFYSIGWRIMKFSVPFINSNHIPKFEFSNLIEMIEIYENYNNKGNSKVFIQFIGKESEEQYNNFFKNLNQNSTH